jgi:hypothetical protein
MYTFFETLCVQGVRVEMDGESRVDRHVKCPILPFDFNLKRDMSIIFYQKFAAANFKKFDSSDLEL